MTDKIKCKGGIEEYAYGLGHKKAKEDILKLIDGFIIGELYMLNDLSTKSYDKIVKRWEEIKQKIKELK